MVDSSYLESELIQIWISILVLSLGFWIAFQMELQTALICVITGFGAHELAHKLSAQRLGYSARYRIFPAGLALGLILAPLGMVFAAPGAVQIWGVLDRRSMAKISAAGSGANLMLSSLGYWLWSILPWKLIHQMVRVNAWLGLFNLLPFPPLDGSKLLGSEPRIYLAMICWGILMILVS